MSINLTCIICPMGCSLKVDKTKDGYTVSGNNCIRGEQFGKEEVTSPKRIVTSLIRTKKGVTSVKTSCPIPKKMIFDVMKEIDKVYVESAKIGDVVIKNVLGTGADIVVTKTI